MLSFKNAMSPRNESALINPKQVAFLIDRKKQFPDGSIQNQTALLSVGGAMLLLVPGLLDEVAKAFAELGVKLARFVTSNGEDVFLVPANVAMILPHVQRTEKGEVHQTSCVGHGGQSILLLEAPYPVVELTVKALLAPTVEETADDAPAPTAVAAPAAKQPAKKRATAATPAA